MLFTIVPIMLVILNFYLIFFLILLNGFFSAAEISLISLRKSRVRHLVKSGNTHSTEDPETSGGTGTVPRHRPDRRYAHRDAGCHFGGVIAIERIKPFLPSVPD